MAKSHRGRRIAADLTRSAKMAMEIPGAAAITLSRRLPMLGEAAVAPDRHGQEINRMVSEKVAASAEAATAVAQGFTAATAVLANATARQASLMWSLAPPAAAWLTPSSMEKQASAARACAEIGEKAATESFNVAARTLVKAMTPVHRKVSANARRLSRSR